MVTRPRRTTSASRCCQRLPRPPQANPPIPSIPGSAMAHTTELPRGCGAPGAALAPPTPCVWISIELTGGQLDTGAPAAQLAGVVGRISIDSGVNAHEESEGRPEQESVTNIGEVRAALSSGVMVTARVPAWPAVTLSGSVDGATAASERVKLGVGAATPVTSLDREVE